MFMLSRKLVLSCLWAAIVLGTAESIFADETVAQLGGIALTESELQRMLGDLPPDSRRRLTSNAGQLQQILRDELMGKALLAEARAKNFDKRPDAIVRLDRARDQALVNAYVAALTQPPRDYPREEETRAFYDSNKASFAAPTQYHLAQIFIASPEDAGPDKANEALKKVADLSSKLQRPGANFAKFAKDRSEHKETAEKAGDSGWFTEDQMVPDIRRHATKLQKGDVTAPIRTAGGWHFVKLLDKRPGAVPPFGEVRSRIVATLRARKAQEARGAYLADVAKKSQLTINQAALDKAVGNHR